jgi:hypothetical protein
MPLDWMFQKSVYHYWQFIAILLVSNSFWVVFCFQTRSHYVAQAGLKLAILARPQWLMPIILATWGGARHLVVQGQPGQTVWETIPQKYPTQPGTSSSHL